jgi:hypothetical protein
MSNEIIDAEFETISSETQEPVQESAPVPTAEELAALAAQAELEQKAAEIKAADIVLLIDAYLKDKAELRDEDDSLNVSNGSIVRWEFKNIPQPSIEELHALIQPVQQKLSQEQINKDSQAFLDATDWIVVRAMERGEELSPEFKAERQAARQRIVK